MAGSLLLLLDDIATVLDDVAAMTKVAAKKTAGVLGDDLALNAKQLAGLRPARELDVILAVARGSALNKLILVPVALAISWLAPWTIQPLLVIGGAYLCYEGVEKLLHRPRRGAKSPDGHHDDAASDSGDASATAERKRITAAVRTDFILSAEIIVIALGVVAKSPIVVQLAVLTLLSVAMTVGVYGLVAAIVKLDDLGALLVRNRRPFARWLGRALIRSAPWLMRGLSVAGTAAMFLVGGGIIAHALPAAHALLHEIVPTGWLPAVALLVDGAIGLLAGFALVGLKMAMPHGRADATLHS